MTVSKRGRVPQTIKEAIQEQFSRMGESYSANIKWGNQLMPITSRSFGKRISQNRFFTPSQ